LGSDPGFDFADFAIRRYAMSVVLLERPAEHVALVRINRPDSLDAALRLETKALHIVFSSHDQKEGMQAFIDKRKPQFQGR